MTFAEWLASDSPAAKLARHMIAVSGNPEWARSIAELAYIDGQVAESVAQAVRLEFSQMPVTAGRVQ